MREIQLDTDPSLTSLPLNAVFLKPISLPVSCGLAFQETRGRRTDNQPHENVERHKARVGDLLVESGGMVIHLCRECGHMRCLPPESAQSLSQSTELGSMQTQMRVPTSWHDPTSANAGMEYLLKESRRPGGEYRLKVKNEIR